MVPVCTFRMAEAPITSPFGSPSTWLIRCLRIEQCRPQICYHCEVKVLAAHLLFWVLSSSWVEVTEAVQHDQTMYQASAGCYQGSDQRPTRDVVVTEDRQTNLAGLASFSEIVL